jgi:hypothetical protein
MQLRNRIDGNGFSATTVGSSLPPFALFMFYYDYCVYLRMLVYNTISISDNVLVTVTRWLPSVEKELLTTPRFYEKMQLRNRIDGNGFSAHFRLLRVVDRSTSPSDCLPRQELYR